MDLICPLDNMIAAEVGFWAKEKHEYLSRYIQISSKARKKYLADENKPNEFKAGATYIDLFCGSGRAKIKRTEEWVDGSAIVAWKASQKSGAPFSHIYISDSDKACLDACEARLIALGAPVTAVHLGAVDAIEWFQSSLNKYALHFVFIDPFDLKSLDFRIIEALANLKRLDTLIHLSQMDLQRNLVSNLRKVKNMASDFDPFIPGWQDVIDTNQGMKHVRSQVIKFWTEKCSQLGIAAAKDVNWRLITGQKNQPLYWLMLVAKHELAHVFWQEAANTSNQDCLF
ncbi:MAG: three-Cys-motif partner protein TcmP [Methylotenera sp.]|nr:three-Cys-motif partner protein TcmP [Methylotenera sp.]MDP2282329.1 three-Cys-motif partner protein TcmP [Methylotenera sp.]MDP3061433.1 three-Cys-motif partner protein TcmP [Methylotenera sp.]